MIVRLLALASTVVVLTSACDSCAPPVNKPPPTKKPPVSGENACVSVDNGPGFQISAKADLRWKRNEQLQNDLMQALSLDAGTVCGELGLPGACFTLIHQVPLGGNDPVKSGLYKPIDQPGVTTPLSTDRVVLSACGIRADIDSLHIPFNEAVWTHIDFSKTKLDKTDAAVAADVTGLYHRFLARDPNADELALVASLADDVNGVPVPPRDFAKMACYAVATTTEALFQ